MLVKFKKSINVIYRNRNTGSERAFSKIQYPFNINTCKQEIEENFYSPIKGIYEKSHN